MAVPVRTAPLAACLVLLSLAACTDSNPGATAEDTPTSFADTDGGLPVADVGPDAIVDADAEADTGTDAEADTEAGTETDTEAGTDAGTETETGTDAEADAEADTVTDADADADADAVTEPDADAVTETDADAVTETDADAVTETDADAVTETDADAVTETDADAVTEPDADAVTETDADTETEPDADTDADTVADAATPWLVAAPAGALSFMPGTSCPAGWERVEAAEGRLVKGTVDPLQVGVTAGAPLTGTTPPVHSHAFTTELVVGSTGIAGVTGCCTGGVGESGSNPLSGTTGPAPDGMPAVYEVLCRALPSLEVAQAHPFPEGAVVFFDASSCPTGFLAMPEAEGRFIVGTPPGGTPGATVGEPLSNGELRVHAHVITSSINVNEKSIAALGGGNKELAAKGAHGFTAQSAQSASGWPYVQYLACRAEAPPQAPPGAAIDDDDLPAGTLVWVEAATCPAGWSPTLEHQGRLSVGLPAEAAPAVVGVALAPGEERTHTHPFSGTFTLPERQVALLAGCCFGNTGAKGTYAFSGTSSATSSGLPYLTLTACERD
ncbi:MAG: hypothetical protein H6746_04010 [Deltaproteobacteria bacterium]|nr:hypothetical protein [Deltaproteobacteria bacterium]